MEIAYVNCCIQIFKIVFPHWQANGKNKDKKVYFKWEKYLLIEVLKIIVKRIRTKTGATLMYNFWVCI